MPVTKKVNKTPCSLCHKVVQELKYHYDICEECHRDEAELSDASIELSDSEYESDNEEPGMEDSQDQESLKYRTNEGMHDLHEDSEEEKSSANDHTN